MSSEAPERINHRRRRFLATATMTIAGLELAMSTRASAASSTTDPAKVPAVNAAQKSFDALTQIDAGVLKGGPTLGVEANPTGCCQSHQQSS
jgi:hypothetical protein